METLKRSLAVIAKINDVVCLVGKHVSWVLIGIMTLTILLQVFFRYVLGDALTWSEEVARFMMVWMTFLIAPIAYRSGANVSLDILAGLVTGRSKAVLTIILHLFVMFVLMIFFIESFGMIERGLRLKASTINIPMAYVYLILPTSFLAMFLIALELVGEAMSFLIDPKDRTRSKGPTNVMTE